MTGKIQEFVLQDLVGRMGAVNHLPIRIVCDDGRAAQPFQNANLDFLRTQSQQAVEAGGKTFQRFARQAGDQIGVDVDAGLLAQETELSASRA